MSRGNINISGFVNSSYKSVDKSIAFFILFLSFLGKNGGKGLKNLSEENLEKMHKIIRLAFD